MTPDTVVCSSRLRSESPGEPGFAVATRRQESLSHWIFGPTEIRVLLAIGNIALLRDPTITAFGARIKLFDLGGAIAIGGMAVMLIVSAWRHIRQLYREERLV